MEEDQEEVVEKADDGELLVIRRALSGLRDNKDEQRENIFHSKVYGEREGVLLDCGWRKLCQCGFLKHGGEALSSSHGSPTPLQHPMA